jgi:hypothetical protein
MRQRACKRLHRRSKRTLRECARIASRLAGTRLATALVITLSLVFAGCQSGQLPDEQSYAGQLYIKRCGQCHVAYKPRSLTAAMWQVQVDAMGPKMTQAGMRPLTPAERATILDYLKRNADRG